MRGIPRAVQDAQIQSILSHIVDISRGYLGLISFVLHESLPQNAVNVFHNFLYIATPIIESWLRNFAWVILEGRRQTFLINIELSYSKTMP